MSDVFNYEIVKDPRIFCEGRLDAHSDHDFYKEKPVRYGRPSDCTYLLNGSWKFAYAKNYAAAPRGFEAPEFDCSAWEDIRVPAHIQLEGYGHPQYCNTQYPWDGLEDIEPGEIPERFNPVGSYVRFFDLPEDWSGEEIHISFQGVESGFALWLNGHYVGYSEDSFTPSEFDLTPYIQAKGNKLAVQVFRYTAGSWCEDQDFFRFSGIFRDVQLLRIPKLHVRDLKVVTNLDDAFTKGTLELSLWATGKGRADLKLLSADGQTVFEGEMDFSKKEASEPSPEAKSEGTAYADRMLSAGELWQAEISCPVDSVKLWSAEIPNLYTLVLDLLDEEGKRSETILERVGFRRFEMKNSMMHINGRRIVFKGVNRHEFSAIKGRCISESEIRQDLITMKRNNINAVRTSHYPNQSAFYRMCDELGLYVIDETNMETHGTWDQIIRGEKPQSYAVPGDRPEYLAMLLDRANNMLQRDKNHPCILLWSCGNESYGGRDFYEMSRYFHRMDPTRLVHYEGIASDLRYPDTTDVVSAMYLPADEIKSFLKKHRKKPFIVCEYAHAMGNSLGAMHKYTDLTEEDPLFQGGFIWDYIDQAIRLKDRYGKEYDGYGGDFGDIPNDGVFCGNGLCYADRTPTPKMQEARFNYQNIAISFEGDQFTIRNKHLFLNTDAYRSKLTLARNGRIIHEEQVSYAVEPESKRSFDLPFAIPKEEGEYVLTISFELKQDQPWAKCGHEVAYGQQVINRRRMEAEASGTEKGKDQKGRLRITRGSWNLGVEGENFRVVFSNLKGGLESYSYAGKEVLKTMPRPNFWRAMTENDRANLLPFRAGAWKAAGTYATLRYAHGRKADKWEIDEREGSIAVTFTYHLPVRPTLDCRVRYEVFPDGEVRTTLTMPPSEKVGELPEFSMLFKMDADFDHLCWYGPGPEETYRDRFHGKIGIYENQVRDNFAPYLRPAECGNKVDVRWARVTDRRGRGLLFTSDKLEFSALPYSPDELDAAEHQNELPPVISTTIRIGRQMGVGGDDTWGALVHPEYLLDNSKEMEISFSFKGI